MLQTLFSKHVEFRFSVAHRPAQGIAVVELVHNEPGASCCLMFAALQHAAYYSASPDHHLEAIVDNTWVDVTKHVGNSLGWSVPGIYYDMAIYRGSSILSYKDCRYFIIGRLIVLSLNRTMLEMHSDFLRLSAFCSCPDIFLLLDSMNIPVGSSIRITLHYNPDYDCHHIRLAQNVLGCIHA